MAIVAIFHLDESHWSVLVCLCRSYVGQCISISLRSVPLVCPVVSTWIVRWPLQQFFTQMSPIGQSWCVYVDRTMASVPVIHLHVSHWSILVCLLGLYDGHCSNISLIISPIFQSWFICLDRTMAIVAIFHLEVSHWSVLLYLLGSYDGHCSNFSLRSVPLVCPVVSTWIVRWPLQQFFTQMSPIGQSWCVYVDRTMASVSVFHLDVFHWSILVVSAWIVRWPLQQFFTYMSPIGQSWFVYLDRTMAIVAIFHLEVSHWSVLVVSAWIVRWPLQQFFTQHISPIGQSCCIYLDRTMAIVAIFHLDVSHWSVLVCLCRPYVGQCISISLRSVPLVCPVVSTWIVRWPLQQFFNQMSPIGQSWCVYVDRTMASVPVIHLHVSHWSILVCLLGLYDGHRSNITLAIHQSHFSVLVQSAWIVRWPLQQFFTQKCPIGQSCCIYLDCTMAIVAIFHLPYISPIFQSWFVCLDRTMAIVAIFHLEVSHWSVLLYLLGSYDGHCSNFSLR